MSERISVIIPVYNTKEYLTRCVHSLTQGEYEELEVILVDDGSTDGSSLLCDELAAEDARIKVYHKENGGSSSARNLGLEKATGEYVGFLDSDDYVSPRMYRALYDALKRKGAQIAQIGRDEVNPDGTKRPDVCTPPSQEEWTQSEAFLRELLMHRGDCSFCTKLIQRDVLAGRQFPVGVLNEDFRLLVELLPHVDGILSLPEYGYHVFYRENSNSRKADRKEFSRVYKDCVDNADWIENQVVLDYPALRDVAKRFALFQRLDYLLHIPVSQMTKDNDFYRSVAAYVRKNRMAAVRSPYLTKKNKLYLLLFSIAPRGIRVVHKKLKGL